MSKDTRSVLDGVRNKIPPNAKMIVCWMDSDGSVRAAQANMTQTDVSQVADMLRASVPSMPSGIFRGELT